MNACLSLTALPNFRIFAILKDEKWFHSVTLFYFAVSYKSLVNLHSLKGHLHLCELCLYFFL